MGKSVAVMGAGPAGIVCARYLLAQGFEPVVFESHSTIGGQWNCHNPASGVWLGMRTNTPRMLTRFSDLDYPEHVSLYPRHDEVLDYLQRYADLFGVTPTVICNARVVEVAARGGDYIVEWSRNGVREQGCFSHVVLAGGRFNTPLRPAIDRSQKTSMSLDDIHAHQYQGVGDYRGKRVVIAGGNISALEIASEMAMGGAASVVTAMRRQRYVFPKLIAGVPIESIRMTRGNALWRELASQADIAEADAAFLRTYIGNPARFGARMPDPDIRQAGATGSLYFLGLVAEGRIDCRPWIHRIDGQCIRFSDHSSTHADALILCTGYALDLPFLNPELAVKAGYRDGRLALPDVTFPPASPGLAFAGYWQQVGAYFPALEQQARYIAYQWAGRIADSQVVGAGAHPRSAEPEVHLQHELTIRLGRYAGVDPKGRVTAAMERTLNQSAVTGLMFRIAGVDALPNAFENLLDEMRRYGPDMPIIS